MIKVWTDTEHSTTKSSSGECRLVGNGKKTEEVSCFSSKAFKQRRLYFLAATHEFDACHMMKRRENDPFSSRSSRMANTLIKLITFASANGFDWNEE
ncbi:uncharacterized protein V6R79_023177 [Siganus canaliculatus]